jgi:hypothetical protein
MRRIVLISLLFASCVSSDDSAKDVHEHTASVRKGPFFQFPPVSYETVSLFYLDSTLYGMNPLKVMEERIMNAPYTDGLAFVDSSGKPNLKYVERQLTTDEKQELTNLFLFPPPDSVLVTTSCVPYYRDVFVFRDKNRRQVAQAQICLECGQGYFTPDSQNLRARFMSGVDQEKLKSFISKVKQH